MRNKCKNKALNEGVVLLDNQSTMSMFNDLINVIENILDRNGYSEACDDLTEIMYDLLYSELDKLTEDDYKEIGRDLVVTILNYMKDNNKEDAKLTQRNYASMFESDFIQRYCKENNIPVFKILKELRDNNPYIKGYDIDLYDEVSEEFEDYIDKWEDELKISQLLYYSTPSDYRWDTIWDFIKKRLELYVID